MLESSSPLPCQLTHKSACVPKDVFPNSSYEDTEIPGGLIRTFFLSHTILFLLLLSLVDTLHEHDLCSREHSRLYYARLYLSAGSNPLLLMLLFNQTIMPIFGNPHTMIVQIKNTMGSLFIFFSHE